MILNTRCQHSSLIFPIFAFRYLNLHCTASRRRHPSSSLEETVLFLASVEFAYINGQNLVADGGFTVVTHSLSTITN
ncbi:hypothetical protein ES319_D10G253500v1 [Gossypium barbadense]|uniref:Uncharacterized protein n=1 Tax=Gossypium barbadense TaxID=3634 RepID=A0A5J5PVT5_GOSBA|nr:hypothetical protein ES319_D10G253500v1 [Gossypium barbadense]